MTRSSIIFSNLKMTAGHGPMQIETEELVDILKTIWRAIVAAQKITHMKVLEGWTFPPQPPPGVLNAETARDYRRMMRQNDKRRTIIYRRKRAIQCCMFVALSFFQLLYPGEDHDFVAEYEDEVVRDTFDRTISIDEAKTYEKLQMKGHCRARLTAPADRIPKWNLPMDRREFVPRFVRNPMKCGTPIVSNLYNRTGEGQEYINLNRNNQPQHLGKARKEETPLTPESMGHVHLQSQSTSLGGGGGGDGGDGGDAGDAAGDKPIRG